MLSVARMMMSPGEGWVDARQTVSGGERPSVTTGCWNVFWSSASEGLKVLLLEL